MISVAASLLLAHVSPNNIGYNRSTRLWAWTCGLMSRACELDPTNMQTLAQESTIRKVNPLGLARYFTLCAVRAIARIIDAGLQSVYWVKMNIDTEEKNKHYEWQQAR